MFVIIGSVIAGLVEKRYKMVIEQMWVIVEAYNSMVPGSEPDRGQIPAWPRLRQYGLSAYATEGVNSVLLLLVQDGCMQHLAVNQTDRPRQR